MRVWIAACVGLVVFAAGTAGEGIRVLSEEGTYVDHPLSLADGVKDPIFSFLVDLALSEGEGRLTGEDFALALGDRKSRVPYEKMVWVERRSTGVPSTLEIDFENGLDVPIPYSILGYNPGDVRASPRLRFAHWILEPMDLAPDETGNAKRMTDVHLLVLEEGRMEIDVDGWLDRLLGKRLDDTQVDALVLFRMEGRFYGVATGTNPKGKGRSGSFDLGEDKVVFPSTPELKQVGRRMRVRAGELRRSVPTPATPS